MAVYNKFQDFAEQLVKGVHHAHAAGDQFKVYLTNATPVATNTIKADIAEIAAGNGYAAGGVDVQNDVTETGGTATVTAVLPGGRKLVREVQRHGDRQRGGCDHHGRGRARGALPVCRAL